VKHVATQIFAKCFLGRLTHMLRSGFSREGVEAAKALDDHILECMARVWGMGVLVSQTLGLLPLRLRDGGMGIRRLVDVVGLAPIASFIDCYSTVEQALGESGLTAQMILN
jgi:hypothetical protein